MYERLHRQSFAIPVNAVAKASMLSLTNYKDTEIAHRVRNRQQQTPMVMELNTEGLLLSANEEALQATGIDLSRDRNRLFHDLECWDNKDEFRQNFDRCFEAALEGLCERMPAKLILKSSQAAWLELSFSYEETSKSKSSTGQGAVIVEGHDVTLRVVSEISRQKYTERLVQLSRKLLTAQEDERRRIAQQLHDQIGQSLTALRLGLHSVHTKLADEELASRLDANMQVVDQVLSQIRNLSLDLRPAMLDDLGLIAALSWFSTRHSELTGLTVDFRTDLSGMRWSSTVEVACFRIAQEAIANAMRHSDSQIIEVGLSMADSCLLLTVRDFGKGFSSEQALEKASEGKSLGLVGMQQRVALVNGEITLESEPDQGSCVFVRIPVV